MAHRFRFVTPSPGSGVLRLADLEWIAEHLRSGGLAVLPTETGPMLAALATDVPALRAAFTAKGRGWHHPMHIACASLAMASEYAHLTEAARRLLGRFTPGPLSVVVRQRQTLPGELVTSQGTVGIRVPDHPATLQVISAVGAPVTATSVNRSGEESQPLDVASLERLDWGACDPVPVVDDPAAVRFSRPSTLVRLTGPRLEVLRPGPVTAEELERALTEPVAGARG